MIDEVKPKHGDVISNPARRPQLLVALVGGTGPQRTAIKEVLAQVQAIAAEIVELPEAPTNQYTGAAIGLLAIFLDTEVQPEWAAEIRAFQSNGQRPMVVALMANRSAELIREALRAGADDVLGTAPTSDEALGVLLRATELLRRGEKPSEKKICSVVSVSGGCGVSHFTVNLGIAARRLLDKRTLLIDLDLQASSLSVLLDIEPEHTISQLADPTSVIDSIRLESVLSPHDSGMYLLAAPRSIEEAELVSTATVDAVLGVLGQIYDIIVIDCGDHLNESSVVAFEKSNHVLYLLDQTVTAVRATQRFLSLYDRLALKTQPKLIVNRYRSDAPVTIKQIESALHLPVFATLPRDDLAFMESQVRGQNLWKISSGAAVRKSLESLARRLFSAELAPIAERPGLFGRIIASMTHREEKWD